ncbi:hypothetical protein [Bradymonas sediminis]|uniref:Uncharacterized protein n=1 Tax=Bradymonas sediminis TaxID=1548548 RepID=A0A2Z4FIW2_9DELT|nr:hypothetical protein [Bradymonas sediminis]AWV88967.1 hypothetical protein DN745_06275 [Bradymonas sediminis]TDP71978.1 hypothetical protein DFR33_108192 [Bradymonas sediminis]
MSDEISYQGFTIDRGSRHCKIIDAQGEVVFRTTNVRDAERYLELLEENDRMHRLLEARGIAPHRIYLLATDHENRGRARKEGHPAKEVVIVAKADDEAVVVRQLGDGREEIVDLMELEAIEGGAYLQASDITDEMVHVVVRFDREEDLVSVSASGSAEKAEEVAADWSEREEPPGSEYSTVLYETEGDVRLYRAEVAIDG